jgi:hypothetical protein
MCACKHFKTILGHSQQASTVLAEMGVASEAQIRRAGRWNAEKMEGCYLTTLPKDALRALAGFSACGGAFFLKRATVEIPSALLDAVFPALAKWEGVQVADIAGQGFLKLMAYLRSVLLQDAAMLESEFPTHLLWSHALFKSTTFQEYTCAVREATRTVPDAVIDSVQAALPVMTNVYKSGMEYVNDRLSQIDRRLGVLEGRLISMDGKIDGIITNGFKIVFNTPSTPEDISAGHPSNGVPSGSSPLEYKLSRSLKTVRDVWMEYTAGVNGGPAIRQLEQQHGNRWRKDETERRFFSRRKVYYDAIALASSELNISVDQVVTLLGAHQAKGKMSLDAFSKLLKNPGAVELC